MPERKLIYADTVVEKLSELILLGDYEKQVINLFVDQCMAVDAVEVVRCKDCRYCQRDVHGLWCFNDYENNLQPDDFCSYGERKHND